MNSLRSLPISRRLWLILALAILTLVLQGAYMLRQIHTDLYHSKAEKTEHVVQSAAGILKHFHALESAGSLSREEAQKQAMELVREMCRRDRARPKRPSPICSMRNCRSA